MEMSVPPPNDSDDSDEETVVDESDIIEEYYVDGEGGCDGEDDYELPDAEEEGDCDGEDDSDGVDDSIQIFTGHTDEVYTAVCSPTDAALVATGAKDEKGFLWKIGHTDWAFELHGHEESVSSLSFSPDGQFLASGSLDGVVKVWNIANGELKCALEGPKDGIEWLRWHPTEHLVLAGSEENSSVCMWDPNWPSYPKYLSAHAESVTCGDFTPDGTRICTGSKDATLRIWDTNTCIVQHVVQGHFYHSGGLKCLTINSDSTLAITGSEDASVHVVNISTGKVVSSLNGHEDSVECAAFEPSSRRDSWRAATGGSDGKLIIWDQRSSSRWIFDHKAGITCLLWLPNSSYIATGCDDGKIRIWKWNSLSEFPEKTFRGHSDEIQSIAASCNGDFLVSASYDGTARVFDIAEFKFR